MASSRKKTIRKRAIRIDQSGKHPLFLFSLTGDELLQIAEISRVSRNDAGRLIGYQRAGVRQHVADIVDYLNTDEVIFPNSLILAIDSNVKFTKSRGPQVDDGLAAAGTLTIPLPNNGSKKPAWIVDGQQRALAISKSKKPDLLVPVNAFVADEVELQRDQFIRVNNTKPLPRGLLTELLPEVSTPLPTRLAARQIPSRLCDLLNQEKGSPFRGLIRRPSTPAGQKRKAVITDTSVVKMIGTSLNTPSGCLFPYRNVATGETDFDAIWGTLVTYWGAVKDTFPEAWAEPPGRSRLMHGVGIKSMGRLMDRVMSSRQIGRRGVRKQVAVELAELKPTCAWTNGRWDELDGRRWNEFQNLSGDVRLLSNYLVRKYMESSVN
jgi:DGQHR domain-containing protein